MLQYFRSCPYSRVAMNVFPHCGQIHVRDVSFQFALFGCLWFHAVRHLSEQNFFLRPLAFCENKPPQFGQMSTYSSSRMTSSCKASALLPFSYCVEMQRQPVQNLEIYPKFKEVFSVSRTVLRDLFRHHFATKDKQELPETPVFQGFFGSSRCFFTFRIASEQEQLAPLPCILRKSTREGAAVFKAKFCRDFTQPPGGFRGPTCRNSKRGSGRAI